MVAKDVEGKLCEVTPLELENEEDVRRCLEAIKRKGSKRMPATNLTMKKIGWLAENVHLLNEGWWF
nr:hypothetical protein [Haliscomenobacter sp.]